MRKIFLFLSFLVILGQTVCAQSVKKETTIRHDIDSLKKLLPGLRLSARVDCMNTLAHKYSWLPETDKQKIDSFIYYCIEANKEAKRIDYKKGLGYSYLGLANIEATKAKIYYDEHDDIDTPHIKRAEEYNKEALLIGEKIKNKVIQGGAWWNLASLIEMRNWNTDFEKWKPDMSQYEDYLKKAVLIHQASGVELQNESYKEQGFVNCTGCIGNERWLGGLNREIGRIYTRRKDFGTAVQYIQKAIGYYEKANETELLGDAFTMLANVHMQAGRFDNQESALKKASNYFRLAGDEAKENQACLTLATNFITRGDFEKGFEYCQRSIELAEKLSANRPSGKLPDRILAQSLFFMSRLYNIAGDYETALQYIHRAHIYYPADSNSLALWSSEAGDIHRLKGHIDSAKLYMFPSKKVEKTGNGRLHLVQLYIELKQYDAAATQLSDLASTARRNNDKAGIGIGLMLEAKIQYEKNNYVLALEKAQQGLGYLRSVQRRPRLIDNYELLSSIFHHLGKNDSAYYYLREYNVLKDSLLNRQFYWRLNNYKKEAEDIKRTSQIKILQKDNQIKEQLLEAGLLVKLRHEAQLELLDKQNEIKDQQLQIKEQSMKEQALLQEKDKSLLILLDKENSLKDHQIKQQSFIRNALLGGLFLFLLLGVFAFRNLSLKRKYERLATAKTQAEFQQKLASLEMQALRAQMNPHFIFNCLSSINRFIFKNDNKVASDYLTRFSRLIRMVLIHSQKKLISLEDELEMMRIYLDLERLRFRDAFDYSITTTNIADVGTVFIPPLLLQPFCENAVWHGLMHKENKGHLKVILNETEKAGEKTLLCIIEDDGVGRKKAADMKSKSAGREKSMGLKITTERLALLNRDNNLHTFYQIEDILDDNNEVAGTRVQLKIKHRETTEEYV
ncbi:MAG TPA: histidine kinase [Chitinophagaceae bacterium]|nr:histidine kinase [Chitinophagaceae bacterium]